MTQTNFSNFRDFSKPGMQISNFHDFPWLSETHVSYTIERGGGGGRGETRTAYNVSHYWSRRQKNEQQNNAPRHTKNYWAEGYLGQAGLLTGRTILN